jgi:serine-type D-Ala-D-Ala carboxypeptidase
MYKKITEETAQRMGIDATRLQAAWKVIDRKIEQAEIPGAAAVIMRHGQTAEYAAGFSVVNGGTRYEATIDTVYDCASLTKVIVTLPLILMLLDHGELCLSDPVAAFLPEFAAGGKENVTIRQLLAHTSGLAAHRDMYSHGFTPDEIFDFICRELPVYEPGTQMIYSCLGFIVLGRIIAKLSGLPLDEAADTCLLRPLGMENSRYNPPQEWLPRIAATEFDRLLGQHRWGRVHDENAHAIGGVSGNAGLFATAHDVIRYAGMWLGNGRVGGRTLLSRAVVESATRSHTQHLGRAARGLGWVLKDDVSDASGDLFSPASYGHTGFTGTSLWIDPERDLAVVLMTNRVHFGRDKSIAGLRACFHNAVAASLID